MQSVHTGMWDPQPVSKHATPLPQAPPSTLRHAHVTAASPAKRITFYKSGDSKFGGVKMAVHKRSFKCFDALLDDLSQKVPLPFGVRTVTTPRGINTIKHLDQLQDGGCYLCSDRRQAKPINMELASKCPSIWYHHSRRPQRPETSSATPPGHLPYRQRRILLVKNSEPRMRRSVVLSRRSTRSLRAFLDEVSEVMQFHVHKLYTAEGRKIDSVQSLITCPGVLVCVGREAFSPLLLNCIKKSSEEKLPGLDSRSPGLGPRTPGNGARSPMTQGARSPPHGGQSRASEYSEGHESKKNVNFGLETKKSIIHPRSDSSNRSTRFSLSSEKSYGNGISACSQPRAAIMNDDIEKRVFVNKDGSLSLEMRVRFRLHSDETLQWSTQIKKSPSLTNDYSSLTQVQPHYLEKGQSETCSDPDSMSFDPESVDYSNHTPQTLEANHCPCCYQRREQQFDFWENPAHKRKQPHHQHSTSHTHTVIRNTNSSSSSSSCNSRRVVHRRARVSSCGGGSGSEQGQLIQEEMCVTESRVEVEQDGDTRVEVCRVSRCCSRSEVVAMDGNTQASSNKSVEDELMTEEERPPSAVSSSSHVLQSLKEDQDDEDEDLPPSASQCCHSKEPSPTHQNNKLSRKNSEEQDRIPSSKSEMSRASCRSGKDKNSKEEKEADDEEEKRVGSGLSGGSQRSEAATMCPNCGGCKHGGHAASQQSHQSHQASSNPASPVDTKENAVNGCSDDDSDNSAVSKQSNKTNLTISGRSAALSNFQEARTSSAMSGTSNPAPATEQEERALSVISATSHRSTRSKRSPSAMSVKSRTSHKSNCREEAEGENTVERAISSLSAKSEVSTKTCASGKSHKSNCPSSAKDVSSTAMEDNEINKETPNKRSDSALSAKSTKSNITSKSGTSRRSTRHEEETEEEAVSARSNLSVKSNKSHQSTKASETTLSPRSEPEGDGEERATSQASASSAASNRSNCKEHETVTNVAEEKENEVEEEEEEEIQERAESDESEKEERAASARSAKSYKSNPNGDTCYEMHDITRDREAKTRTASVLSGKSQANVNGVVDRTSSAISVKSSKSRVTDCTSASPHKEEKQTENQERIASAMSVKSRSSAKSKTSYKSRSSKYLTTGQEIDEERNEAAELAKSRKSDSSNHNGTADCAIIDTIDFLDQYLSPRRTRSPRINSPSSHPAVSNSPQCPRAQNLLSGQSAGEKKGPSALSVHSTTSTQSGRPKCHCGAASANEVDDDQEKASERAISFLSSSSRRQRKESGGTEQPLSRCSSGSVSLGLPEDQETGDSDSGKSSVSFHTNTESKGRVKTADPDVLKSKERSAKQEDVEETRSKNNASKSTMTLNPTAVEIPTIKTPAAGEDEDEGGGGTKTARAATALSAKSSKSSCKCSTIQTEPVNGDNLNAPKNRPSSSMSTASAKVRNKSPASASAKNANVAKTPVEDFDAKNQNRPVSETAETVSVHSKSPCRLRPESAASAKSRSKPKEDSVKALKAKSTTGRDKGALSHSLSAADPLKETIAVRPHSQQRSEKSEKCQRTRNHKDKEELTPAYLPNASPNEVVSHWLQSIPANSSMLGLGDELEEGEQEKEVDEEREEEVAEEEDSPEVEKVDNKEITEADREEEKQGEGICNEEQSSNPTPGDALGNSCPDHGKSLPRNWQSSVAVMKVLLNSSMGRCQSMPEVSPVYGRRLSTSARGFLDCLAQLQLIGPAVNQQKNHNQQYEDIMAILQSLWLTEPRDIDTANVKDSGPEQVTPPRSSSGVDMSSGSGGSGKENINQGGEETSPGPSTDAAKKQVQSEEQSTIPSSLDSPKATENPSSSDKSSANDSSKSPTDNETMDDTSSGTPPTVLHAPLSKRSSQDPDPVWVLHLLKKLEKQFINHYINAMAEFKVRWDLDDSLILNTMISELREEVSRRIQSSIEREIRKIQTRAGRGGRSPRPPQGRNLSRDSTMTEKRRKMLKVMKNQSLKTADSLSDGETTGDFSDQRSEDEYCPCDACVRKKLATRPLKTNPVATEAPVMMEFDLLKILQLKKGPLPPPVATPKSTDMKGGSTIQEQEEEGRNLEVVQEEEEWEEEEEKTKEDIKAEIVLEEAIPEEDEEVEEGDTGRKDNSVHEEEQKEEEEEKEESEETNNDTGEDESADDGEKGEEEKGTEADSDKETVKEARAGEGENTENGEGEEDSDNDVKNEEPIQAKDGNDEDEGGESEDEEGASTKEQEVTEREEDTDTCVAAGTTGNEEETGEPGDEDETVEEVKSEKEGDEVTCKKTQNAALLHQFTRTSVESQPGSL
ncbi:microtubule-associated protein futsch [Solea solea]|uniref:microtubule-associated protein futsch n=1 Tax=Solea solea TaxID=90069 RepID=UPI0027297C2C|nr:microtubule-associated protein futsch [Solea solea]